MKIVLNQSHGPFSVSKIFRRYFNIPDNESITRFDRRLIQFIEKFGSTKASGDTSYLVVQNIPSKTLYRIETHDGCEKVELFDKSEWDIAK